MFGFKTSTIIWAIGIAIIITAYVFMNVGTREFAEYTEEITEIKTGGNELSEKLNEVYNNNSDLFNEIQHDLNQINLLMLLNENKKELPYTFTNFTNHLKSNIVIAENELNTNLEKMLQLFTDDIFDDISNPLNKNINEMNILLNSDNYSLNAYKILQQERMSIIMDIYILTDNQFQKRLDLETRYQLIFNVNENEMRAAIESAAQKYPELL